APEMLVQMYENNEAPAVIINSNFALDGGLNPQEDSIALEDSDSPYANLVAVREGDQDRDDIKKLMEVLQGDEIKQLIEENYGGRHPGRIEPQKIPAADRTAAGIFLFEKGQQRNRRINRGGRCMKIFTIGHSDHSKERLLEMLWYASIESVIDVRAFPAS